MKELFKLESRTGAESDPSNQLTTGVGMLETRTRESTGAEVEPQPAKDTSVRWSRFHRKLYLPDMQNPGLPCIFPALLARVAEGTGRPSARSRSPGFSVACYSGLCIKVSPTGMRLSSIEELPLVPVLQ